MSVQETTRVTTNRSRHERGPGSSLALSGPLGRGGSVKHFARGLPGSLDLGPSARKCALKARSLLSAHCCGSDLGAEADPAELGQIGSRDPRLQLQKQKMRKRALMKMRALSSQFRTDAEKNPAPDFWAASGGRAPHRADPPAPPNPGLLLLPHVMKKDLRHALAVHEARLLLTLRGIRVAPQWQVAMPAQRHDLRAAEKISETSEAQRVSRPRLDEKGMREVQTVATDKPGKKPRGTIDKNAPRADGASLQTTPTSTILRARKLSETHHAHMRTSGRKGSWFGTHLSGSLATIVVS